MAAHVAGGSSVPIVSPSSTNPTLSDGRAYPYFLRTPPSDDFIATATTDVLKHLWGYTAVSLVFSTDAYGAGAASAFTDVAARVGLIVRIRLSFPKDASDFSTQVEGLRASGLGITVIFCLARDGARFLRAAYGAGLGGDGYLWLAGDTFAGSGLWLNDPVLASDASLRLRVLKGLFAAAPNGQRPGTPIYDSYVERRRRLLSTTGDGMACNLEKDDDGTLLWAQHPDGNASAPLTCAGDDPAQDSQYDGFAYDAVLAIAHAVHDLVEVRNVTVLTGSDLLQSLISSVRFEGVTGLVDFHDASAHPDRIGHGDRRVGFSYALLNYASNDQGLVAVGSWTPCSSVSCAWDERWQPTGQPLTYSTVDNSLPVLGMLPASCPPGQESTAGMACACSQGLEYNSETFVCENCAAGSFKAIVSSSKPCSACPPGEVMVRTHTLLHIQLTPAWTRCSAGTYQPATGSITCFECEMGYHQPGTGMQSCARCQHPANSFRGSARCDVCSPSFYDPQLRPNMPRPSASAAECLSCSAISGFDCGSNATIASVSLQRGFWRISNATTQAFKCKTDGAWTPCLGGSRAGWDGDGYCAAEYGGPKCELCTQPDHFFDHLGARCRACGSVAARIVGLVSVAGENVAHYARLVAQQAI